MTRPLNDVLTVAGALALLLPTLGCDSSPSGSTSTSQPGAGTAGAASSPDAGIAGTTSAPNAGAAGATPQVDAGGGAGGTSGLDAGTAGAKFDQDAAGAKLGPYAVGHATYMLADTGYDRTVAVSVWYPVDSTTITTTTPRAQYPMDPFTTNLPVSSSRDWEALGYDPAYEAPTPAAGGPFPLVVLSPGWGWPGWTYLFIGTRLASHGFVVAITDHDRDWDWPWSSGDSAVVTMYHRNRDVSFALTQLLQKNGASGDLLQGAIDPSKIAMTGHHLGGYTAYALAGGDDKVCDALWVARYSGDAPLPYPQSTCVPVARDPRIGAIVSLDGFSPYLRYEELARISVPSLILGETVEHIYAYQVPDFADPDFARYQARPHAAINRGDSYRVDLKTANQSSFANWCDGLKVMSNLGVVTVGTTSVATWSSSWPCVPKDTFDPKNDPVARQIVTTYMLAFLNTEFGLKDDSGMLTSDYATQHQPEVEFFDSEACSASPPGSTQYTYRPHAGQCVVAEKDPVGYFWEGTDTPVPDFQIQEQGYVVAGTWAGYAFPVAITSQASGAGTTTITPADFSGVAAGAAELCVQGSVGAASDYGGVAMLGVNVNQVQAQPDGGVPQVQTVGLGGSGVTVQYSNPGGTAIRLQVQTPAGETSGDGRWCANLSGYGGTETVPWTAFTHSCWTQGGVNPPEGTQISQVFLYVPGGNTAAVPYSFCLQGIAQAS